MHQSYFVMASSIIHNLNMKDNWHVCINMNSTFYENTIGLKQQVLRTESDISLITIRKEALCRTVSYSNITTKMN
jgi:hypothetical protein